MTTDNKNWVNKYDAEIMEWVYEVMKINFDVVMIQDSTDLREILSQAIKEIQETARKDERDKIVKIVEEMKYGGKEGNEHDETLTDLIKSMK